jgi:nicotinamidase-related amidase
MRSDQSEKKPTAPARDVERGNIALLILDMINCFDFEGAEILEPKARCAAKAILNLRTIAGKAGWPIIYVNDNFGEWHSERSRLIDRALKRKNPVCEMLRPRRTDYFVIKPQFSGFYSTNLPVLLPKLGVDRLILTGIATDICILFTAADAHMRDYRLWIPEDATAAESDSRGAAALAIMRKSLAAETAPTSQLKAKDWAARP